MLAQEKNGASTAPFLARPRTRRWLAMILILWLALFLRVWQLETLPPGLHYDEAFNGTMAREVLRGIQRPIFFTPNFGEEPLHIYTEALLFSILGESPWTIRLVSAIFGVIFVAALYACARVFFPRSDFVALVAAFIAATLYWAINFSRIGIETNGLPMLIALSAAALGHAYRKMQWHWVLGAGFLMGATLYTYLASRLWLPAVFLWFVYLVILYPRVVREHFSKWVVMGAAALLTLAPLILFFVLNPVAFSGRSGTVFTPEIFALNAARTAGMFFFLGDLDPRDNLPGRPALDILLALFFGIGLIVALARFRKPLYALLLIWFVVMCLPSALTEFAPNFRRAIGAMPAMILLCALGVEWLWKSKLQIANFQFARVLQLAVIAALALSAFWSGRAYFVEWASGTGLFYSFDAGLLRVANALAARPRADALYLTPDYDEHYTVIWALDGRAISSFDGRRAWVLPDSSRAASYGIITREDTVTEKWLSERGVSARLAEQFVDADGKPYATVYEIPATNAPSQSQRIRVGDFAELPATRVSPLPPRTEQDIRVELQWLALKAADKNYTVSVQLIGPPDPVTGSRLWAQEDKQPAGGTFPTSAWRTGEQIFETFTLKLAREAAPGDYLIQASVYWLETGERVPLFDTNDARIQNDAWTLATFTLE